MPCSNWISLCLIWQECGYGKLVLNVESKTLLSVGNLKGGKNIRFRLLPQVGYVAPQCLHQNLAWRARACSLSNNRPHAAYSANLVRLRTHEENSGDSVSLVAKAKFRTSSGPITIFS